MANRFLGWRMVGVAFFVDFVAVGFFFYSYGVFFTAIEQEFGGSRLGVSLGLTVTATVGAVLAPFIGQALGAMRPAMFPVQIIGVPLAGAIYDATGSYTPAFLVFIVLYLLAAALALAFRDPAAAVD